MKPNFIKRIRNAEDTGQALVEMCLIVFVLALMAFGAVEMASIISHQNRLATVTREGGRLWVKYDINPEISTSLAIIQSEVRDPMFKSIVMPGESQLMYAIIFSNIRRIDPRGDTDINDDTTEPDDYIHITHQYKYLNSNPVSSQVGNVNTRVAQYGDPSSMPLPLGFLIPNENSVVVECYRKNVNLTGFQNFFGSLLSEYLYEVAYF